MFAIGDLVLSEWEPSRRRNLDSKVLNMHKVAENAIRLEFRTCLLGNLFMAASRLLLSDTS
jgi:hypothetical protein